MAYARGWGTAVRTKKLRVGPSNTRRVRTKAALPKGAVPSIRKVKINGKAAEQILYKPMRSVYRVGGVQIQVRAKPQKAPLKFLVSNFSNKKPARVKVKYQLDTRSDAPTSGTRQRLRAALRK